MGQAKHLDLFDSYLETPDAAQATPWQLEQLQRLDLSGGSGDPMACYAGIRRVLAQAEESRVFPAVARPAKKNAQG